MPSILLPECIICATPHTYTTTCHPSHSASLCRPCWTCHVKSELALSPYHGCRCPYCRAPITENDVLRALLPQQKALQEAKRRADYVELVQQGGQREQHGDMDITLVGGTRQTVMEFQQLESVRITNALRSGPPRMRLRGGVQEEGTQVRERPVRPFGLSAERAALREERKRRIAEANEIQARARAEHDAYIAARDAVAGGEVDETWWHPDY